MLTFKGTRRTPKEMAALLIWNLVEELPADWNPPPEVTGAEARAVVEQLEKIKARIADMLRIEETL
jgi:hypothetical protein